MKQFFVLFFFILPQLMHIENKMQPSIRIMSFNMWNSGNNVEDGLLKIVKHIKMVNPDIVALQEVENGLSFDDIIHLLGPEWSGYSHTGVYPDTGLLSRHKIYPESISEICIATGAKIGIATGSPFFPLINVSFWSIHTDSMSYGPYAACNKLVTDESQIMAGEMELSSRRIGRIQNAHELLNDPKFTSAIHYANEEPVILAGDFNSPSHLDWLNENKDEHCDWSFAWPVTKIIMNGSGLEDSFRHLHPDPTAFPGTTWSTVQKFSDSGWGWTIPEPQDRIDMILYRSQRLIPLDSYTYQGSEIVNRKPNHFHNDYPSDHAAVITQFGINYDRFSSIEMYFEDILN